MAGGCALFGKLEEMRLKQVVEGAETRVGRFFDSVVTAVAAVSLSFETLSDLQPET